MIVSYAWIELSDAVKTKIVEQMCESFGKHLKHDAELRFLRGSCTVDFFYPAGSDSYAAICIRWRFADIDYADKIFVVKSFLGRGLGRRFLNEWADDANSRLCDRVWRTSEELANGYYGKHKRVETLFRFGTYVFQGIRQSHRSKKKYWELEDIQEMTTLDSAFEP